jgi:predicted  nucleic acid-binding Zn-ribbon protein
MDPLQGALQQMQTMASLAGKQALLNKRQVALDLTLLEGEIAVVQARAAVAEAEAAKLQLDLDSLDATAGPVERELLEAKIAAADLVRRNNLELAEAIGGMLEIKKEVAAISLEVDPHLLSNLAAQLKQDIDGDDSTD